MSKYLVFDMDGTIVDFYGVTDWQKAIDINQDATPYAIAKPIYNMFQLNAIIKAFRKMGYKIIVSSWLSKVNTAPEFQQEIINAKLAWLKEHSFFYDEVYFLPYGTDKSSAISHLNGLKILIDDNDEVLKSWHGPTIDAKYNIIESLVGVLGGHVRENA